MKSSMPSSRSPATTEAASSLTLAGACPAPHARPASRICCLAWADTIVVNAMGLLDSEAGRRRLLTVELPVIEQYNKDRDPEYRIVVQKVGTSLVLKYQLKPTHNIYRVETRLLSSYPTVPPETRVITALLHCPHLLEGQMLCLWRQGSSRITSRWDPSRFTCIFAVQAAWRWLACYEVWHSTGEWPLPEAK